jgi:hypothetical protein
MKVFALETERLQTLEAIAERLQSGSDQMRDEGHKLWLVLQEIKSVGEVEIGG